MSDSLIGTTDTKEDVYLPSENSGSAGGRKTVINVDMGCQRQRSPGKHLRRLPRQWLSIPGGEERVTKGKTWQMWGPTQTQKWTGRT